MQAIRMTKAKPGVSRDNRISDEGLQRLEKQLQRGAKISEKVLRQWIVRYGTDAEVLISKYRDNRTTDDA